ncbi:hypothetical protein M885DRAFT_574328 [Pelagophyceae sp. CCMP2097]|nr:hypothetical protein M885DRAFT_574328 [Pelagophyceae sp. CCMP2097]
MASRASTSVPIGAAARARDDSACDAVWACCADEIVALLSLRDGTRLAAAGAAMRAQVQQRALRHFVRLRSPALGALSPTLRDARGWGPLCHLLLRAEPAQPTAAVVLRQLEAKCVVCLTLSARGGAPLCSGRARVGAAVAHRVVLSERRHGGWDSDVVETSRAAVDDAASFLLRVPRGALPELRLSTLRPGHRGGGLRLTLTFTEAATGRTAIFFDGVVGFGDDDDDDGGAAREQVLRTYDEHYCRPQLVQPRWLSPALDADDFRPVDPAAWDARGYVGERLDVKVRATCEHDAAAGPRGAAPDAVRLAGLRCTFKRVGYLRGAGGVTGCETRLPIRLSALPRLLRTLDWV